MKTVLKVLTAAALIAAFGLSQAVAKSAQVGSPAPDFTLTDIEGKTYRLSELKGKTVVLEWTNPDCPIVKKHYDRSGNIPSLQQKATGDGVVWLSINSASKGGQGDYAPEKVKSWQQKNKSNPTAYLRDPTHQVGKLYDARTTPHLFVIDPNGTLVYNGAIDSISSGNPDDIAKAENYVVSALSAVKNGGTPAKGTTKPYGCAIKY